MEYREYHTPGLAQEAAECIAAFNQNQLAAFERITSAISTVGRSFCMNHVALRKTYVYNTLCH